MRENVCEREKRVGEWGWRGARLCVLIVCCACVDECVSL